MHSDACYCELVVLSISQYRDTTSILHDATETIVGSTTLIVRAGHYALPGPGGARLVYQGIRGVPRKRARGLSRGGGRLEIIGGPRGASRKTPLYLETCLTGLPAQK